MKYRYSALPDLAFTEWDGDAEAVYSPTAAKTHLLSAAAVMVLRALCQRPEAVASPELALAIETDAPGSPEGEQLPTVDVHVVQQLLDDLYIAGLTHRHE